MTRSCNVASFRLLVVAQCFLSWSTVTSLTTKSFSSFVRSAACTDDELSEYALLVAVGPAKSPRCQPSAGQVLFAPALQTPIQGLLQSEHGGEMTVSSQVRLQKPGKGGTHFVHLHVVQSDVHWCELPCDGPSWELAAPKPEKGSPYVLLEAAIWRQFRNVTLYQFDAEWEKLARNSHQALCAGKDWRCKAYAKHREAKALITVGPWPEELDYDPSGLSAYIQKAFAKVFAKVQQLAGKDNSRIGITYSGHGGQADGGLFADAIHAQDAIPLLQGLVSSGGKFPIFNFGTNCQEGRWNMLAALQPFADHILASDLDVGGLQQAAGEDPQESIELMQAKEKLADVSVLKQVMEARQTVDVAVTEIIKKRGELWLGVMKDAITKQKLRQSISAFVSTKFSDFAGALKVAYQKLAVDQQEEVLARAESSECDVLVVARDMDSAVAAPDGASNFLQQENVTRRRTNGTGPLDLGPLEAQFMDFRSQYASTQSLFSWTPVTNGLGFNFRKWEGHKYHCDLESALGTLGCGPICKKRVADAKAKEVAQKAHEERQEEKYQKAMKKIMREHFEAEEQDAGKMSAEEKAREQKRHRDRVQDH